MQWQTTGKGRKGIVEVNLKNRKVKDILRGEGIVLFLTSDPLAVVGFLRGTGLIIKIKLVQSIGKSQKHQTVDKKEFKDV